SVCRMVATLPYLYAHRCRFQSVVCSLHLPTSKPCKSMAAFAGALALGAASALGIREILVRFVRGQRRKGTNNVKHSSDHVNPTSQSSWNPAKHVPHPHPGWRPGDSQPCPLPDATNFLAVDADVTPSSELYPLVISAVVPRPIAFVSTVDADGTVNLSPYSFFNAMGFNPPTVAIGLCHSPGRPDGKKDTLHNIELTGEFVVNIISEWFIEAANHTCGDYPPGVDEMRLAGLTPLPSTKVRPPRVAESAVHMECKLRHIHHVHDASGAVSTSIVIGQVLAYHISSAVAARSPSGKLVVDLTRLAPVARCGGFTYARASELYDMPRPDREGRYPQGFLQEQRQQEQPQGGFAMLNGPKPLQQPQH
ncbi:hypothetical protein Agub_g2206, partial [Astrephomene gubernaculifera]